MNAIDLRSSGIGIGILSSRVDREHVVGLKLENVDKMLQHLFFLEKKYVNTEY